MSVPALPATLGPPAPFPLVIAQSSEHDFVAPGVRRATYRMQTTDGPLVINVVAVDPREPTVRVRSVLANDRMVSAGETVRAMARRTGAVAGVNADYFDIGATNQPLNIVVRDGALLRTPSKRVVFDVRGDRSVRFENVTFSGSLRYGATTVPITAINEWPPQGGVALLDEAFGTAKPSPGVTVLDMVPVESEHAPLHPAGAFRIAAPGDATRAHVVRGYELAFGPAALALGEPPRVGDPVVVDIATMPALDDLAYAVGGGPTLVARGVPVDDPNAPAPEERDRRFPVSGAATLADGRLLLFCVDGRDTRHSIGLTRPQFAALALAFASTDAMAFDSGGSAELVARVLGDAEASVLGTPSDGEERVVADGVFVYSDAPPGPASQLVVRPSPIVAMPHARVNVRAAIVDAAGHALGSTHLAGGDTIRAGTASSVALVRAGALEAAVPIEVVDRLARLDLEADVRHPEPRTIVRLHATGYDARGREVAIGSGLRVRGRDGTFDASVPYRLGDRDERFEAVVGEATARLALRVGRRVVDLDLFDAKNAPAWRFATAPPGGTGSLGFANEPPELRLAYDFTRDGRAAYARAAGIALPGEPLGFAIDVAGDGSGVALRASFVNGLGETRAVTLAPHVDWHGWQRKTLMLPPDVTPPVRLTALYVVTGVGGAATHAAGTIALRAPAAIVAGRP
ncbi:MAG: hypothetical protein NVS3B17_00930 [Vulcanimicrobiaceae bacterium]